jgi:photosystem II stability/assembly factor-like uncharacterized protein
VTGRSPREVVLLVGTRKGLFRAVSGPNRREWRVEGPLLEGWEVFHATLDPRDTDVGLAAVRHDVWGTHVCRSGDAGRSWEQLPARPRFGADEDRKVEAIWHLAPGPGGPPGRWYAGVEPAALFVTDDAGGGWRRLDALDRAPGRDRWQPAKGGLALHSVQVDPRDPDRVYAAVSAGGVYRTEDGGASWAPMNRGLRADFLPDERPEAGQCVHCLRLHPTRPDRLYQQNHCGTYRSDDRGESWTEITRGLPSDFGYVVGLDPADPDRCWTVPQESSHMRSVCGGRFRVYETADAGASWTPRTGGLPQEHAYLSVLREALDTDGLDPCGVYMGTSTGHVFVSPDGRSWDRVASFLPRVLSVTAAPVGG